MQFDFAMVLAFILAGIAFAFGSLLAGSLLRPRFPTAEKSLTYECGERPFGRAWFNFNPRFYIVALVFVIFEVEIALTIPVALVFRDFVYRNLGLLALLEIAVFILILFAGLVWLWARKDLEWVRRLDRGPADRAVPPVSA